MEFLTTTRQKVKSAYEPSIGIFLLTPGWDDSPSQGYPSIKFAGTHLHTWVERGTVRE